MKSDEMLCSKLLPYFDWIPKQAYAIITKIGMFPMLFFQAVLNNQKHQPKHRDNLTTLFTDAY